MKELKLTGGARIGMANATFPFASIHVNTSNLTLNASLLGYFNFRPCDVISIEPYIFIPIVGQGIKIIHNNSTYKKNIIFWTFKKPSEVIKLIEETGFLDRNKETSASLNPKHLKSKPTTNFPFKKRFLIGLFIVWNLLFLADIIPFIINKDERFLVGYGIKTALITLGLIAFLSLTSVRFRHFILKEGQELSSIKLFMVFILIVSIFFLLIFI